MGFVGYNSTLGMGNSNTVYKFITKIATTKATLPVFQHNVSVRPVLKEVPLHPVELEWANYPLLVVNIKQGFNKFRLIYHLILSFLLSL